MPTILEAMKTSQNPFSVAGFKAIATTDMLFSLLNFVPKAGDSFEYTREKSVGSFGFIADNYNGDIAQSTGLDEKVTVPKRQAVADFYVDAFAQSNQSGLISPADRQTIKKFKAAGRTLADKLINGKNNTGFVMEAFQAGAYITAVTTGPWLDSNRQGSGMIRYTHSGTKVAFRAPGDSQFGPDVTANADGIYPLFGDNPSKWIMATITVAHANANASRKIDFTSSSDEFDGLKNLISTGQTRSALGANGDPATYGILDELIDAVKVWEDGKMAFLMNADAKRTYESINRGMGGSSPYTLPSGRTVPQYKGVPMLTNDFILNNETLGTASNLSSIYLVNLAAEDGFWMGALGGASFDVQADPRNATVLGFNLIDLGPIQKGAGNKFGKRLAWYGAPAIGSDLSVARAKCIKVK